MAGAKRRKATVRVSENFSRNLEEARSFLEERAASGDFDRLVTVLLEELIPNLELFPSYGVDFAQRRLGSQQARLLQQRLSSLTRDGEQIREYILGDYLVLYSHDAGDHEVHLLAIRHHRQLSFDFRGHWR